jgi:RNA polymerase sigma factor (sigma-70 family)
VEERSLEGLYRFHVHGLMRFATTLVGPSDAADVVSDAIESLLASNQLASAEDPPALMHRAVFAKARSMQRSSFRRRAREQRFARELTVKSPSLRPDVVAAVVGLSPRQRACVYLTYWHDLAPAEVGRWLDISEGTVKRHLARARAHLRRIIDE